MCIFAYVCMYVSTEPFTIQEVVNAIKNLPSRKAAGQDRLKYEHLKRNLNTIKITLMNIFNTCFVNKKIPKQWKESVSILLLKRDENNKPKDSTNIKNWREIGLSVTLYKVYMMLIKNRLLPWMFETKRLSSRQKVEVRERDCKNMCFVSRRQSKILNTNRGNST